MTTGNDWRADTLNELYPLVPQERDPDDFRRIWQGAMSYLAGIHASCAMPGRADQVDFSGALLALKAGFIVARAAWDGTARWVVLQTGYPDGIETNGNTAAATGLPPGSLTIFAPYLMARAGNGAIQRAGSVTRAPAFVPWQPSMEDLLADDWRILAMPGVPPKTDDVDVHFGDSLRVKR